MHHQRVPEPPAEPVAGRRPVSVPYGRPRVHYHPLPGHVVPAGRADRQARALMLCFELLDLADGAAGDELEYMAWRLSKTAEQFGFLASAEGAAQRDRAARTDSPTTH